MALRENSIYLPVILNPANVATMDSVECITAIKKLLERSYTGALTALDEKILMRFHGFPKV